MENINNALTTPLPPIAIGAIGTGRGGGANILHKIISTKIVEIAKRKSEKNLSQLENEVGFNRKCVSLKASLLGSETGIITEFKRKSPSKGWIHKDANVLEIPKQYCEMGAAGISILTDEPFFGGSPKDLIAARPLVTCPILRKDFIVNEYQIYESKAMGADVILLIASALSANQTKEFAKKAKALGLEVLLEIHNKEELSYINEYVDIVGVNNRNLKDFKVSTDISKELANLIPNEFVKISESGISDPKTVIELRKFGYKGFLMGENFMKTEKPAETLKKFIGEICPLTP